MIVAIGGPITLAVSAATGTIPIVASGDTSLAVVPPLARPGGNITGIRVTGSEIYGKRLQILKEAVPSASRVAYLDIRTFWESAAGQIGMSPGLAPLRIWCTSFAMRRQSDIAQPAQLRRSNGTTCDRCVAGAVSGARQFSA